MLGLFSHETITTKSQPIKAVYTSHHVEGLVLRFTRRDAQEDTGASESDVDPQAQAMDGTGRCHVHAA